MEPPGRPPRDVLHLGAARRRQRVELEPGRLVAHIHPVEREHVQVHVEPQRAVRALHHGDGAGRRLLRGFTS